MRLPKSLQWRIALAYGVLIILSMAGVSIYIFIFVRGTYISDLETRLEHEARLVSQTLESYFDGALDIDNLQAESVRIGEVIGARITVISQDGTVLADTWEDPSLMGNHADHPEVREAFANGLGSGARFSNAVQEELLYTAAPIFAAGDIRGIARVAVPTSDVQSNINQIIAGVALSGLVVTALAVVIGYLLARRTSRSVRSVTQGARYLAQGRLDHRVQALAEDETKELAETFNNMATTLRSTFQELSAERNKLSTVLQTIGDGVVVIGPRNEIVLINPVALELLGANSKDPIGKSFIQVSHHAELHQLAAKAAQSGEPQFGETEGVNRRYLNAVAVPFLEQGSPAGILMTLQDLTRARQIDTTRKEFISNVSHELRSPLASAKAAVETLQDGALDDPGAARDFLERLDQDINRMTDLAGDLLELSRLESGEVPVHLYPEKVGPILEQAASAFQHRSQAQGVAVTTDIAADLPFAICDKEKVHRVVANLLDNALKFTGDGGAVTLRATRASAGIEVQVSDTGSGIRREHLPHVFERFYKADRSRRDGGTGLGLAIVKHTVELHGGEVKVDSEEGRGSTFTFTLPASR